MSRNADELAAAIQREIDFAFPTMYVFVSDGQVVARGSFPLDAQGNILDRFLVEIAVPLDFPEHLPLVYEVGGRIPRDPDRHINDSGECCLFLPEDQSNTWRPASGFLGFLHGPVLDFFLGQLIVEHGGGWPSGEWQHGVSGIVDFYAVASKAPAGPATLGFIEFLAAARVGWRDRCYCGRSKTLEACHAANVLYWRARVSRDRAAKSLETIRAFLAK